MAEWSTLPCDILGEIALKLDSCDNFASFSAAVVLNIDDDLFVMVIHKPFHNLALARPEDREWTPILTECSKKRQVMDVMDWDGKIVITYMDGSLAYCDIGKHPIKPNTFTSLFFLDVLQFEAVGSVYIVELDGDLLVVLRHRKSGLKYDERGLRTRITKRWSNGDCYRTYDFQVYKYVGNTTNSWKQVTDLGEHLLFLGDNIVIALHISKAPNCHQNTIYFIDDETYHWKMSFETEVRGHDMGMFDMATEKIQPFYHKSTGIIKTDIISQYSSPI
ncbi:uncharacterized protein LOC110733729 [Chenopodium quinoa]|uniref:uncharacterized protein LOC110733729 n=1 Tax=Chenopodium quinoa TaxID=63459 RepID=UPI000B7919B5|nr:uncharacterized protein LOC110733729 [Chenopodium quinoa]